MNYFVCTYGHFPEQDEMVERSIKEGVYLLHQYARYPSAIDEVRAGDVLLLNVRGEGIVSYAYAAGSVKHIEAADEWNYVLKTRDGWHEGNSRKCWSPYGIAWATLRGGQFSLVKTVESTWANGIFDEMGWERPVQHQSNTADVGLEMKPHLPLQMNSWRECWKYLPSSEVLSGMRQDLKSCGTR